MIPDRAANNESRPDDRSLPDKVIAALDRLSRVRRMHRQAVASAHGLSGLQVDLLMTLAGGLPVEPSVGALAHELCVTQPTATDSLRTLERKGLVRHERAESDRRRHLVRLTVDGARIVAEADRSDRAGREAVARLDDTEQEAAFTTLLDIIASFADAGVVQVARTCLTCHFHQRTDVGGHHCALLDADLAPGDLRLDCPEHVPARIAPSSEAG